MGNCLQQPGQLINQLQKSMRENSPRLLNLRHLDYSCYRDKVNRAAGLRAVVMVFASPSGQLYRDTEILSTYRDFAKTHANPDTDGNFPYHRAVSVHWWKNATETIPLWTKDSFLTISRDSSWFTRDKLTKTKRTLTHEYRQMCRRNFCLSPRELYREN